MAPEMHDDLFRTLDEKGRLKQLVYRNTLESLRLIREATADMGREYREQYGSDPTAIPFHFQDEGEFETRIQFAGDVLVFLMHTNVFEFSRYHEVMTTSYIREDKDRSYCGIISIYNFLSDSFKYNRVNDLGYLIGRIFVNKDRCYFIEGKREVGLLYNNFGKEVMDKARARKIVESAMLYAIRFDLLTPPYDALKEITLGEIRSMVDGTTLKTGKRLGFRFQADSTDDRID